MFDSDSNTTTRFAARRVADSVRILPYGRRSRLAPSTDRKGANV
jgi:hypothetical protein